jgi:hypothetical protein
LKGIFLGFLATFFIDIAIGKCPYDVNTDNALDTNQIKHERTATTAKNMGILKYHPTSLILKAMKEVGPWHAWKILSNQTSPPITLFIYVFFSGNFPD